MSDAPAPTAPAAVSATAPAAGSAAPGGGPTLPPRPPARWLDPAVLPILAGVVVLGGAVAFLFSTPRANTSAETFRAGQQAQDQRLDALEQLPARISALETRPNPAEGLPERAAANERRIAALEGTSQELQARTEGIPQRAQANNERFGALERGVQELTARPPGDPALRPLVDDLGARLGALDGRGTEIARRLEERVAAAEAGATQRLSAAEARATEAERRLEGRVTTAEARATEAETRAQARVAEAERALATRITEAERQIAERVAAAEAAVAPRLAALDAALNQRVQVAGAELERRATEQRAAIDGRLSAFDERVRAAEGAERRVALVAARGAIGAALEAGRPLGNALAGLPDAAPAALSRFASAPPPTEAALRLGFDDAARAARAAADPASSAPNSGVVDSALARLQGLVTVRRGEQVIVGDAVSGELETARRSLEAGDLAAAVARLERLPAPPREAMGEWLTQARALLDARGALRDLPSGAMPAASGANPGRNNN